MRIISQKQDYSFDFHRTTFWMQGNYIYAKMGIDNQVIGAFASADRASEVFREMHNEYSVGRVKLYYIPEV
mgnify:CR=1 FL=1